MAGRNVTSEDLPGSPKPDLASAPVPTGPDVRPSGSASFFAENWLQAAQAMEGVVPSPQQPTYTWTPGPSDRWRFGRETSDADRAAEPPSPGPRPAAAPATMPAASTPEIASPASAAPMPATAIADGADASSAKRTPTDGGEKFEDALDIESLPAVLTVDELAALLRVERKSAYAAVARREIPGVRQVGRAIRISRDAVVDWLRQGGVARARRKT